MANTLKESLDEIGKEYDIKELTAESLVQIAVDDENVVAKMKLRLDAIVVEMDALKEEQVQLIHNVQHYQPVNINIFKALVNKELEKAAKG